MKRVLDMEKFIRNKELIFRNLGDEGLALSTQQGEMTGVNATAAVLLEALETPQTLDTLHQKLQLEFEDTGPKEDVSVFLKHALASNLIQRVEA